MQVGTRLADVADVERIIEMYRTAAGEQNALREMWEITDGIAEPAHDSLARVMADDQARVYVGTIDEVVFGFLVARIEGLLPQADGQRVGVIPLIYVEDPARQVGVAEAMLESAMEWLMAQGIKRFDAIVSPGHRLAKNFFESAGFKARRITMHRYDG